MVMLRILASRVGRVLVLASQPLPLGYDLQQTIAIFLALVGGSALLGVIWNFAPALIFAVAAGVILLFIAAFRLRSRIDDIEARNPMVALRVDPDRGFQRIIVKNPNDFPVKNVTVQLVEFHAFDTWRPDLARPAHSFCFAWSSWLTKGGATEMDFAAGAEKAVDIAARPEGNHPPSVGGLPTFFFVHVSGDPMLPQRPTYLQTWGEYHLALSIASEDLPKAGKVTAIVAFQKPDVLTMRLASE